MSAMQRALVRAVQSSLALARRTMPDFLLKRVRGSAIVAAVASPVGQSFDRRPVTLLDWSSLLPKAAFDGGPLIFANAALAWGGAERQLVTTMKGLAARGMASSLLCLRLHEDEDLDFFAPALAAHPGFVRNAMTAAEAERVLAAATPRAREVKAAIAWLPFDVQGEVLRFAGEFATRKPSIVHAWQDGTCIAAGYAALLVGVPKIVLSARSVAPDNFHYMRAYMADAYRELAACQSVVMLNNSEAGARDYVRWLGIDRARITVLRNGVDADALRRPTADERSAQRAGLDIPANAPVVGTIIRFSPVKQPMLWIETAAMVARARPDCHFVIHGTGPLRDQVIAFARREGFGERLHCPGTIDDVALGLSAFDVFLLTSEVEGTPNVVLEASLLGVPVVATAVGGTGETISEGVTGLAVANANAAKLAGALLSLLDDATAAQRAAAEGRVFVQRRFGVARMLDETAAVYRAHAS
jgi:glycosyltransferase involved in cell wall biosynthesis